MQDITSPRVSKRANEIQMANVPRGLLVPPLLQVVQDPLQTRAPD